MCLLACGTRLKAPAVPRAGLAFTDLIRNPDVSQRLGRCPAQHTGTARQGRGDRTLCIVLALNIGLKAVFFATGAFGDYSAFIVNELDNFSDSFVYAIRFSP